MCVCLYTCIYMYIFWPHSMWDLSYQPEVEPVFPAVETWSLNHQGSPQSI